MFDSCLLASFSGLAGVLPTALTNHGLVIGAADSQEQLPRLKDRGAGGLTHDMPFMNNTGMTDADRALLGQGIRMHQ